VADIAIVRFGSLAPPVPFDLLFTATRKRDEQLALRLLRRIMQWGEDVATQEYAWVRLLASLKYDGYGDYVAGVRFAESLAGWLAQFEPGDRQTAYDFVKHRLVYFSAGEVKRLVVELQPRFVEPMLRKAVGEVCKVPAHMTLVDRNASAELARRRRQTLYIGLSDGARIDILRRANAGALVNDQIVLAAHIDHEKWEDLGSNLATDLAKLGRTGDAFFRNVILIDDFTASGTTFVRKKNAEKWTGKIYKFFTAVAETRRQFLESGKNFPLAPNAAVHVHHYISTTPARNAILDRLQAVKTDVPDWFPDVTVTEGLLLPQIVAVDETRDAEIWKLTEKYYDPDIYEQLKAHLSADQKDLKRGYADCALPVVLEHNCPNNSLTLLWAETEGKDGAHPMRALFPRRHRHS
jgi:hypothetical protein